MDPVELRLELTQSRILSGTQQVIGTVSVSPPAVREVFVSFDRSGLIVRNVSIPPGGSAPVEVVAPSVTESSDVQLIADVFTVTGFLTATRTVTVVTCPELLGQSIEISTSQSSCPSASYKVRAVNVKDDPLSVQEVTVEPNAETLPPEIEFYNGEIFRLELLKVEAGVTTIVASSAAVLLDLPVAQDPTELFSKPYKPYPVVLVAFSETDGTNHKFLPLLAGEALLAVTGADGVFKVRVGVPNCRGLTVCNYTLGSTRPEFDSLIRSYSLTHGIPAQIVKAQIERESGTKFNPRAYRYEPLTVDFQLFARGGRNFGTLRDRLYAPWRLASSCRQQSLTDGSDVLGLYAGPDVVPRHRYSIQIDPDDEPVCEFGIGVANVRKITPDDHLVPMENILLSNDTQNWTRTPGGSEQLARYSNYRKTDGDPFAAQTVVAASYGLMQVLYSTAVEEMRYQRNGVGLPPARLFNPESAIDLGTEYVSRGQAFGGLTPAFANYTAFQLHYGYGLLRYNKGTWAPLYAARLPSCLPQTGESHPRVEYACNILFESEKYYPKRF